MTVEELNVIVSANASNFNTQMAQVQRQLGNMGTAAERSGATALNAFKGLATGIAALQIGKLIKDSITSAMDAVESESLFAVSMGAFEKEAREWSEGLSESLGLNSYALRKNLGTLYNMTTSMGIAGDTAYELSKGVTELAEDMASFYNLSSEEAFAKLKSGLTGEAEPLKALGILVDENTVKQYAYKTGIAQTGSELTQQQKVLARYQAILSQTANAQGDLARTADSPSNMLRRLKNEMNSLMVEAGTAMLPLVKAAIPVLTGTLSAVRPFVLMAAESIGALGNMVEELGDKFENATPSQKIMLQLAIGMAVAIPAVTAATKLMTAAKAGYTALLTVLIPKQLTFGAALKSTLGWIGLIAGALALFGIFSNESAEATEYSGKQLEKEKKLLSEMAKETDAAADSTDDFTNAVKRSTAGFDELNKLGGSGTLASGIVSDEDIAKAEEYTDIISDVENATSEQSIDVPIDLSLDGLYNGLKSAVNWLTTNGYQLLKDAVANIFDIVGNVWALIFGDSDEKYQALQELNEKVKGLFGEDFVNFFESVGEDIFKIFNGTSEEQYNALVSLNDKFKEFFGDFGEDWSDFWTEIGEGIFEFANGDLLKGLEKINSQFEKLFGDIGKVWSSVLQGVGGGIYEMLHAGDIKLSELDTKYYSLQSEMSSTIIERLRQGDTAEAALEYAKQNHLKDTEMMYYFNKGLSQYINIDIVEEWADNLFKNSKHLRTYASGGFPDYGSLFIANESGPELVGTLGGRTAVVNNAQIENALYNAVYSAFSNANAGSTGGDIRVYVELDGEVVAEAVARQNEIRNKRFNGR